jgi:hypothetical protein
MSTNDRVTSLIRTGIMNPRQRGQCIGSPPVGYIYNTFRNVFVHMTHA